MLLTLIISGATLHSDMLSVRFRECSRLQLTSNALQYEVARGALIRVVANDREM